ncbi:MAG: regulatory iron-sulfur-containing complex subunit RicT [Pirellulaceae bacterium]
MNTRNNATFTRGDEVVVRTSRGLEAGQVLCEASDSVIEYMNRAPAGTIQRPLSDDDASQLAHLFQLKSKRWEFCEKAIADLNLDMKLVDIEQILGGERVVVYFVSEDRVNFRDLVKVLAAEFQTRIEMTQIGVRDEAKLLADYGDCGKPVCCNTHLSAMPPVSMKMAKLQKATLDPTKISGRCGRLKCCLRYEFDHYEESYKELPNVGTNVVTREGKGRVVNVDLLGRQLIVEMEDHRRTMLDASEILSVIKKDQRRKNSKGDSAEDTD